MKYLAFILFFSVGAGLGAGALLFLKWRAPLPADDSLAAARSLADAAGEAGRRKNLGGVLEGLASVEGPRPDGFVESLAPLVNGRLENYFSKVLLPDLRPKALGKIESLLKEKDWLAKSPDVRRETPNCFAQADWRWVFPEREIQLNLRVARLNAGTDGVTVSVRLLHPRFLEEERRRREKIYWAILADAGLTSGLAAAGLGILFFDKRPRASVDVSV